MKEIQLTQGKVALVDDQDYDWLNQYKWYAHKDHNIYYAVRTVYVAGDNQGTEQMHRLILGLQRGDKRHTDHRDRNGLNNQLSNLRLCTNAENLRHQQLHCNNSTGYKGVHIDRRSSKRPYIAQIRFSNKVVYIGCYQTVVAAAEAYDLLALKHQGEFALTNRMLGLL